MFRFVLSFFLVALLCVERAQAIAEKSAPALEEQRRIPEWTPMWLVAHFPMAVRATPIPPEGHRYGITEATLIGTVTARLREYDVSLSRYSPRSPMPHLLVTLRMMAFQPTDQRHRPIATYVLTLSVLDPMILDCPRNRTVFALIWQRDHAGFALLKDYPRAVQAALSELALRFTSDYLKASGAVSRLDYDERLAAQYACVTN